jgi:hypothetical protein
MDRYDFAAMTEVEEARFRTFVHATDALERSWLAFAQFEGAVSRAAACAGLLTGTGPDANHAPHPLRILLRDMLFGLLPRVELGTLIAEAEGIGYALRYGIIDVCRDALESVADTAAYEDLAERGYAAPVMRCGGCAAGERIGARGGVDEED